MRTLPAPSACSMRMRSTESERRHGFVPLSSGVRQFPPGGSTVRGGSLKTWNHAPGPAKSRSSRGVRAPAMPKRPPAHNHQESRTRTRLSPFFSPDSAEEPGALRSRFQDAAERQGLISEEMGTIRNEMGAFLTQMAAFPTGMREGPIGMPSPPIWMEASPSGRQAFPSRSEQSDLDGNDPHQKGKLSHRDGRLPHLDRSGPTRRGSSAIWMGAFPTWMQGRPFGTE